MAGINGIDDDDEDEKICAACPLHSTEPALQRIKPL
jgi:hypothetical protein